MTGRQYLNRALFRVQIGMASGVGLFAVEFFVIALAADHFHRLGNHTIFACLISVLVVSSLLAFGGPFAYGYLSLRCPFCRVSLYSLMAQGKPERIKCCPYCVTSLDDPMPDFTDVKKGMGKKATVKKGKDGGWVGCD